MAKADLEMAVLKAQTSTPLNEVELLELLDVDFGLLLREFDLDLIQAEHVLMWKKHEALRYQAQLKSFPQPLEESKSLSVRELNKIIIES